MNDRKSKIISKLRNRGAPYICRIVIGDQEFDDLTRTFEEICEERELKFVLLPPMFPMEKNKLKHAIMNHVDFPGKIVMLSKTDWLPHHETVTSVLGSNMYLFIVHTRGKDSRFVWEVIK